MKTCSRCQREQPLDVFHRHRRTSDGRNSYCKECASEARRRWYSENREHAKAWSQDYYAKNREDIKARTRENYEANREQRLAQMREYRKRTWAERWPKVREYYRQKARRYYREHREVYRGYGARRRAAIGVVTPETNAYVAAIQSEPCVYCGSSENIEIDHIVPLARGGAHKPENLAPACRSCNRSKGAKFVSEWLTEAA